jgi:hypothetical protein
MLTLGCLITQMDLSLFFLSFFGFFVSLFIIIIFFSYYLNYYLYQDLNFFIIIFFYIKMNLLSRRRSDHMHGIRTIEVIEVTKLYTKIVSKRGQKRS